MVNLIYNLLLMSISGTIMYIISLLFSGRRQYAWLRYALLVTSVMLMLLPIQAFCRLPKIVRVTVPEDVFVSGGYVVSGTAPARGLDAAHIAVMVWAGASAVLLMRFALKYLRSARLLRGITEEARGERELAALSAATERLHIRRRVELHTSKYLRTPMLFGILKPMIILPVGEFSDKELEMILTHELVHYKHLDLAAALAAAVAKCVHWYNPAIYLAERDLITARELCCDETVLELIGERSKKDYGDLILSVIETNAERRLVCTTAMASSRISIQRRLIKIIEHKAHSRLFRLGCVMLVLSCGVSSITAFGFERAARLLPAEIRREIGSGLPDAAEPVIPAETEPPAGTVPPVELPEAEPEILPEAELPAPEPAETQQPAPIPETYFFGGDETAAEVTAEPEYEAVDLAETSFLFKPDFSEGDVIRSDYFGAAEDMRVSVIKYADTGSDLRIEIYDAETGGLAAGETEETRRRQVYFTAEAGKKYYILAYCTTGGCDGIYISGME